MGKLESDLNEAVRENLGLEETDNGTKPILPRQSKVSLEPLLEDVSDTPGIQDEDKDGLHKKQEWSAETYMTDFNSAEDVSGDKDISYERSDHFDAEKFHRGRQFVLDNIFGFVLTSIASLYVSGTVERLTNTIETTGTVCPAKLYNRFARTTRKICSWCVDDIWDSRSKAAKSMRSVRFSHKRIRQLLRHDGEYITQQDMALFQHLNIRCTIVCPEMYGIRSTREDLDAFVYFWYWIGYLLGIDDKYNVCLGGLDRCLDISKKLEETVVYKWMKKPYRGFNGGTTLYSDGLNESICFPFFSAKSMLYYYAWGTNVNDHWRPKLSLLDLFRVHCLRLVTALVYYFSFLMKLLNKQIAFFG